MCANETVLDGAKNILVDEKANSFIYDLDSEALEPLFKLKGDHVIQSYMLRSKALAKGNVKAGIDASESHLLAVLSKNTTIQIWDIDH